MIEFNSFFYFFYYSLLGNQNHLLFIGKFMDIGEERYKKVVGEYRTTFNNIINEYPVSSRDFAESQRFRNLKYITGKAILSSNYPYYHPIYEEALEEIKSTLSDPDPQVKALALRMARSLPFPFRITIIEMCENEITNAVLAQQKRDNASVPHPYGYEAAADFSELLLSVLELTTQSDDIYFDVNQRIISIFARFLESAIANDKSSFRNACEVLRNIFWVFGAQQKRGQPIDNKLITKLISTFMPSSSFVNKQEVSVLGAGGGSMLGGTSKSNSKLLGLVLKVRQFQARLRGRLFYGFCCLVSYLPCADYELLDVLSKQVLLVLQNISECDVTLDCFSCLAVLVTQEQHYSSRNIILKRWFAVLTDLAYRKEYLEYYVLLLEVVNHRQFSVPHRLKYALAIHCLELTRHVQQQYTRFVLYVKCCEAITEVGRISYARAADCSLLLSIFQYGWFIDRINQQNDLFKSQLLIALLHAFAVEPAASSRQEVIDLLDLCHRLIDWKCTSKEETHIPTLKFAFDMYLSFLRRASEVLENAIEPNIVELINRCNEPSIYFLFKFKLIDTLLSLPWYQQNYKYLQTAKLNFQFIEDEVRLVMMPKNPKPIFTYEYSLTYDGEVESRKEIEYIKIIMHLLNHIQKVHDSYAEDIQSIILDYHKYLSDLENREDSNKELVNCLQTLEADYYFNDSQKNFLLAVIGNPLDVRNCNYETNLEETLLYSHCQTIQFEDEVNIFGPMSPVQLTIRLHPHPSYSSVYIHVKKNQWVQTQTELKLIVSSAIEKKELPFESSILEIKVDRIGSLHFQVWKGTNNDLLLGSGNYRLKRKLAWRRADHLSVIDGIKTKAYFKECEPNAPTETYLSYYYGEPILIHILKSQNEVVFGVTSKEVWNQIRDVVSSLIQDLSTGRAHLITGTD